MLIQNGNLFNYWPAESITPARRDYDPSNPPEIESEILAESRPYRVLLPRGYEEHSARRYPVLYLHDGQASFEPDSFTLKDVPPITGIWPALDPGGMKLSTLMQHAQIREIIVVAVDAVTFDSRTRDYLPPGDSAEYPPGNVVSGEAHNYARFLIEELKPHIDTRYRTYPDRDNTGTAGFSYGGLVSMYLGRDYTETFSRIGSWSGSFWLDNFRDCCRD